MALSPTIVRQIRVEIGTDKDVTDEAVDPPAPLGDLETIYEDIKLGNYSVLRTALAVYRLRLNSFQNKAFDATAGGSLFARSQRGRFLARRVAELAILVDYTLKGSNVSTVSANTPSEGSEFA